MVALSTLLSVVAISVVVVRVATKALELTGLSQDAARFQAFSAFTGTGFTTEEAEGVVRHPVRRRIVMLLMLLRNAGLVTAISMLVLSFVGAAREAALVRSGMLLGGLLLLWLLARSRWVDRGLERLIDWALARYTDLDVRDFYRLLNLAEDYTVARFEIEPGTWLEGQRLGDADLPREGVLVLAVVRPDGEYVGAPRGELTLRAGDTVVLYGRSGLLSELKQRLAGTTGEAAHERAKEEHAREVEEQETNG